MDILLPVGIRDSYCTSILNDLHNIIFYLFTAVTFLVLEIVTRFFVLFTSWLDKLFLKSEKTYRLQGAINLELFLSVGKL